MSARGHFDAGALASMMQRPGIDPRVWLTLAVVQEMGHDPQEGHFAEVRPMPCGPLFTCYIGTPYAGADFGAHFPMQVGDTVLVAIPMGDTGHGPRVISRFWDASDNPPSEVADEAQADEPSQNVVIKVRQGQMLRIIVDGDGADVVIDLRGSSKCRIGPDGDTFPAAGAPRTDDEISKLKDDIDAINRTITQMKTAHDSHLHVLGAATSATGGPVTGTTVATATTFPTAPTAHTPESVACDQVEIY